MYIRNQTKIRVTDVDKIVEEVKSTGKRLDDAMNLLHTVASKCLDLEVDVYDTTDGPKFTIRLTDTEDVPVRLRCAIRELEEVLKEFENLHLMVGKLQKKISHPKE